MTASAIDRPMRRRLFIPIAAGMAVAYLAQFLVVMHAYDGMRALRQASMDWLPWLVVAPLVVWFAERVPVSARTCAWTIPVHAVFCVAVLVVHVGIGYVIGVAMPGGAPVGTPQYGERPARLLAEVPDWPEAEVASLPEEPPASVPRFLRARILVPIYFALVAATHAAAFHRRVLERERAVLQAERLLAETRLAALRQQLQPHFLFNTLNSISSLIFTRPEDADDMVCALSELLRGVLSAGEREDVTLAEEVRLVGAYLGIQRIRFGEKLRYSIELPPALEAATVPMLLLQPIVENAVVHGIARRPDGGEVCIAASNTGGRLQIDVTNTIPDLSRVGPASHPNPGIGLKNCRERLVARHGGEASLQAGPDGPGRWRTTVALPLRPGLTLS